MTLLDLLPKDIENIIFDYKYNLEMTEHIVKFKKVNKVIKKMEIYYEFNNNNNILYRYIMLKYGVNKYIFNNIFMVIEKGIHNSYYNKSKIIINNNIHKNFKIKYNNIKDKNDKTKYFNKNMRIVHLKKDFINLNSNFYNLWLNTDMLKVVKFYNKYFNIKYELY